MRENTRSRQCTTSSGPVANATTHGPRKALSPAKATTAANSTAVSAVADHSLGNSATRLPAIATSTTSNAPGGTGGAGAPSATDTAPPTTPTANNAHE